MIVHLLRHADAENFVTTDAARSLTPRGQGEAGSVANFLSRTRQQIDLILTSPYTRALQTAQAVASKIGMPLSEERRLSCGMSPQTGLALLQEHRRFENILLVGHQPDLSIFAACLLTEDRSLEVEFGKASLLSIEMIAFALGKGTLKSYIPVEFT